MNRISAPLIIRQMRKDWIDSSKEVEEREERWRWWKEEIGRGGEKGDVEKGCNEQIGVNE